MAGSQKALYWPRQCDSQHRLLHISVLKYKLPKLCGKCLLSTALYNCTTGFPSIPIVASVVYQVYINFSLFVEVVVNVRKCLGAAPLQKTTDA